VNTGEASPDLARVKAELDLRVQSLPLLFSTKKVFAPLTVTEVSKSPGAARVAADDIEAPTSAAAFR
jgi:hypothetical protein